MPSTPQGLQLGVTLFSFTNEFHSRQCSFEQLLATVAELGMGPGVEVVGYQSIRGFPTISDEFAARFKDLMARYRLQPSCLAINSDVAIRRTRMMTVDEAVAYHEPQIRAAAKLGFPVVRSQFTAPPEVLLRLLPLIEKLQVKIGPEVHSPVTVNSPPMLAYREMYAKAKSPFFGFIPDMGSCAVAPPPGYLAYLKRNGAPDDLLQMALEIWKSDQDAHAKREEFTRRATASGAHPSAITPLAVLFSILCPQDPRAWLDIMPQVIHIHGKFYEFDSNGSEPSIPYEQLLPVFIRAGYQGYLSSEYEGTMYSSASGIDMVQKHQALCRRIIASL
jgi:sugar phosphate isomerase/epimerase